MSFDTITVIGLGYIGLPTAAMFASRGKKVIGVDVNHRTVDTINRGEIHIVEPELDVLVRSAVKKGCLRATTVVETADAFLIAVPTPFKKRTEEIPEPDLSYIQEAAQAIAPVLKTGDLVVLESTSPVGTTEQLADWLATSRPDLTFPQMVGCDADVNIAHCPERVLPGHVVRELVQNNRVIGGMSAICSERAVELYQCFVAGECVQTSARTAEMVKLAENSCRDVQIAFANELSVICDKLDINVWELISLANRHPRINILQPGPGVGGHCIAVDPWFIVSKTPAESRLIKTARVVNDAKPDWVLHKFESALLEHMKIYPEKAEKDVTVACYGLTFKANIDDLRGSPALHIAEKISTKYTVRVLTVEPNITELPPAMAGRPNTELVSLEEAERVADIRLFLVDHAEFKTQDICRSSALTIDTRGILPQ